VSLNNIHSFSHLDCIHQIDTKSDHHTEYTRYIWNEDKSVHFLGVLYSAIKRDKLNNGLDDALGNNNVNKGVHIIVDVLQNPIVNKLYIKAKVRNATWWENDFEKLKSTKTTALNQFRRNRANTNIKGKCVETLLQMLPLL